MDRAFLICGNIKHYEWGKLGITSSVAQLLKSTHRSAEISEIKPYAELWMGTHPSGSAYIPSLDTKLVDLLSRHPELLGKKITEIFDTTGLPFLLKVLSINKALSIQVHPDKQTAEKLHRNFSDNYPDNNHKPELAVALTEFHALCGFRPIAEIKAFITELPQLQALIGQETAAEFLRSKSSDRDLIKSVFKAFISRKEEEFQPLLAELIEFITSQTSLGNLCNSVKDIFLTLYKDFPGDIGCFSVFFLNYMVLQPGEAIFLAANEPHAYLLGDCVECMACSDNVVRAGLTPKYKDVDTLCDILSYNCKSASENIFTPVDDENDPFIKIFDPPVPDFSIVKIEITVPNSKYVLKALDSASILIVIEGSADASILGADETKRFALRKGFVLFIACETEMEFHITSQKILMFRAFCN